MMSDNERNALAELAEELDYNHFPHTCSKAQDAALRKAQRIIAELANIGWWRSPFGWRPRGNGTSEIIIKCREIAEEGVNNVKNN